MKKITFGFALVALMLGFTSTSFAHYFYQNHNHDNLAVRPHTERIAPLSYYRQFYHDYYRCGSGGCVEEANVEIPRTPNSVLLQNYQSRPTEAGDLTREANTYQERYIVVREGNYVDRLYGYDTSTIESTGHRYTIADNADYALVWPAGFGETSAGEFRSPDTSLAFRVLGLDQNQCNTDNFWTCAQTQNRAFRASSSFDFVQNPETSFRWNQTDHANFDYFPTITESFDATVNGNPYTYYTYTALNPNDQTMIRIEAVSSRHESSTAVEQAFNIFETFRFR